VTDGLTDIFQVIAERKIVEAIERGLFDDLPGQGRPLLLNQDPLEAPHQRLAHTLLKNAGFAPPEVSLRSELAELKRDYARAKNAEQRQALARDIRLMVLRINLMRQRPIHAEATEALVETTY
jgi:hypothetical protein